jgi:hypothetical protein
MPVPSHVAGRLSVKPDPQSGVDEIVTLPPVHGPSAPPQAQLVHVRVSVMVVSTTTGLVVAL